jgi:hypothetical protein
MQALNVLKAYEELVWRKGDERCERSYKQAPMQAQGPAQAQRVEQAQQVPTVQAQQVPTVQAHEAQQMELSIVPDGFRQVSSKREEVSAKINERYLVGQATQNPFMPSNNYIQDIENQMNFLTPQKSG